MTVIGVGNTGMMLATKFKENPLLISTAHQDTINFEDKEVYSFSEDGASKRFRNGARIWASSFEELEEICEPIFDENVIVFSSLGGGSGSSCLNPLSRILLRNNNKVLLITILPYKKEINPPLANAVQALNSLMPIIQRVSVIIFDNEKLRKAIGNDWEEINKYILKRVDYLLNMIKKYSMDEYSPLTLDQSELESVIFGGGFIDISNTFLEEDMPKFEYGKLDKETKNCLIAMFVDHDIEEVEEYHNILTGVIDKISTRITNARMIPGILRGKIVNSYSEQGIKDRAYITLASGLNIDKYLTKIEKLRDLAVKKAIVFSEKRKGEKFIERTENRLLDI
jgi:cell division GTPase FtsZ